MKEYLTFKEIATGDSKAYDLAFGEMAKDIGGAVGIPSNDRLKGKTGSDILEEYIRDLHQALLYDTSASFTFGEDNSSGVLLQVNTIPSRFIHSGHVEQILSASYGGNRIKEISASYDPLRQDVDAVCVNEGCKYVDTAGNVQVNKGYMSIDNTRDPIRAEKYLTQFVNNIVNNFSQSESAPNEDSNDISDIVDGDDQVSKIVDFDEWKIAANDL